MKKFLLLPIILAIGFGLLIVINTDSGSTNTEGEEDAGEVIKSPTGLKFIERQIGEGPEARSGDVVLVHYTGRLKNGTKFDSSVDRGEPFKFTLGRGQVIQGWDEGIAGMKAGGKRKLIIPSKLGYGAEGSGKIPGNAELHFEVELVAIK